MCLLRTVIFILDIKIWAPMLLTPQPNIDRKSQEIDGQKSQQQQQQPMNLHLILQ